MHVVHLLYRLDYGGLEKFMLGMVDQLCNAGCKNTIICLTGASEIKSELHPQAELYELNKAPGYDLKVHYRLYKLLRQLKPEILHTYNLATIEYHPIAKLAGVNYSLHAEHGRDASDPQGLNPKHRILRRLIQPFIDSIVCVSDDIREWQQSYIKVPAKKLSLIANSVDTKKFTVRETLDSRDTIRFVHVARLDPVKNQSLLLRAFAEFLQEHRGLLRIVGDGPERQKLENLVDELGIRESVVFEGFRQDIHEIMCESDVFLLSSLAEGTPITVLEAMSTGLPIVTTSVGGLPQLVEHAASGLLVPPGDDQAYVEALTYYVDNRTACEQHGRRGRQIIDEQYTAEQTMSKYLALYDNAKCN